MHIRYDDIIDKISEAPIWWLYGIPRYRSFAPNDLNVYAREAVLMRVECQMCFKQFDVGQYYPDKRFGGEHFPYREDPPSHASDVEEYCGGDSMGFSELQVLEFWRRVPGSTEWARDHSREEIFSEPSA